MKSSLAFSLVLLLSACGGAEPHPAPAPAPPPATSPGEPTPPAANPNADLVARGQALYGKRCAACHGNGGEGSKKAPAVVGVAAGALPRAPRAGAKRDIEFRTAGDILGWVSKHMPGDAPGSLAADDYLAILAFDLTANGVDLGATPFTAEIAAGMVIHPD